MVQQFSFVPLRLGLVLLAAILLLAAKIWPVGPKAVAGETAVSSPAPQTDTVPSPAADSDPAILLKQRAQKTLLQASWGRDPFSQPSTEKLGPVEEQSLAQDFVLTGVLRRGGRKVAIINHMFVAEGETFQGVRVERIENDRVVLKKDQKEFTLLMGAV